MPVARSTPGGSHLTDGYSTKIALTVDPDISFWEKTVQPPAVDGGDPIPQTTMFNTAWRTNAARSLKSLSPIRVTAAYSAETYEDIIAACNINTLITLHFPDTAQLDFYGYLQKFEPGDNKEGEQPEATITIVPTLRHSSTGAETAPVYTAPGT